MNQNLFSKNKKYKKIGIAVIAILTIIIFLRNVRFQSVSDYKAQQQSMVDEYNRNSEKQSGDVTTNPKSTGEELGEVNNGSTNGESDIDTVDMSENGSINNRDGQITDPNNMANNNTINGISSNNGSDSKNIDGDNSGATISNNGRKDNNGSTVSEIQYVTCTIEIRCDALSNNMSKWTNQNKNPTNIVPLDGKILKTTTIVKIGSTAYKVLLDETKMRDIPMDASFSMAFNTYYIESINHIGEKDAGDLSGWIYKINGQTLPYGISEYKVKDGDVISLLYTCNMGSDLE